MLRGVSCAGRFASCLRALIIRLSFDVIKIHVLPFQSKIKSAFLSLSPPKSYHTKEVSGFSVSPFSWRLSQQLSRLAGEARGSRFRSVAAEFDVGLARPKGYLAKTSLFALAIFLLLRVSTKLTGRKGGVLGAGPSRYSLMAHLATESSW